MNTEELEKSLRAEFEGQMNSSLDKIRAEFVDLQTCYQSEFEKYRSQMDDAFRQLSEKLDKPFEFDRAFSESVVEHLRLARDEGAQITATAMGEAEKLAAVEPLPEPRFGELRNAINEIKANSTQATILSALVDSAAYFAPRGAFFIVKNDHLVGWKVFGNGESIDDETIRSVHFPTSSETILSTAINSLTNAQGAFGDEVENAKFLGPLSFGSPSKMYAIPLCARGRGVAVLYADGGEAEAAVNLEALEALVSVAALRIELLASLTAMPHAESHTESAAASEEIAETNNTDVVSAEAEETAELSEGFVGEPDAVSETESENVEDSVQAGEDAPKVAVETEFVSDGVDVAVDENGSSNGQETSDFAFSSNNFSDEAPTVEAEVFEDEQPNETIPVAEVLPESQPRSSYRERTVDLPIEVSEDERRPHSDARRFARLLVSEIRLYNEQKVIEGRETGEIYEILKEAIDRSREMYEKRVQPDVAEKFDYFHYELVNTLAEGDEEKLGAGYLAVKA